MSMVTNHYVGYYFWCQPVDGKDVYEFEDESFVRIWDEGGSKDINEAHIFICTEECPDCAMLSDQKTGIMGFSSTELPNLLYAAQDKLEKHYKFVELRYGVISFLN